MAYTSDSSRSDRVLGNVPLYRVQFIVAMAPVAVCWLGNGQLRWQVLAKGRKLYGSQAGAQVQR